MVNGDKVVWGDVMELQRCLFWCEWMCFGGLLCLVCVLCFACTFCVLFLCVLCLCVVFCSLVLFYLCFLFVIFISCVLQACAGVSSLIPQKTMFCAVRLTTQNTQHQYNARPVLSAHYIDLHDPFFPPPHILCLCAQFPPKK